MAVMMTPPAMRDMAGEWLAFMGINRDDPVTYQNAVAFAKAPADEAWVYSCIRQLYTSAQGVPLRVYVRDGKSLTPASETTDTAARDLQYLLDYVNPLDMTGDDLKAYTNAAMGVWGETFWAKVRGKFGGAPQELYWLRSPDVEIKSANGRWADSYVHQPNGQQPQTYQPRDVVPFKTVNLVNPLRGLSPLASIGNDIATGRALSQKSAALIQNDSIPPMYWQVPKESEFTPQDESLVRKTLRMLKGPKNKGKVPIMPQGIEAKSIALTPQASEAIATGKISRMAICAALGVPLVLAGDDDKNTVYGNLRDAERIFWRRFIPTLDHQAAAINNWLTPDFDPTRRRLVVGWDYTEIEALRPTLDVEWNAWLGGIYAQAVVPNEFRRKFHVGPDVDWGEKPVPRTTHTIAERAMVTAEQAEEGVEDEPVTGPETVAATGDTADSLRAYGRGLYRHPAVRAWVAAPHEPLDIGSLLGGRFVDTPTRLAIEAGLRRRDTAGVIADAIQGVAV